MLAARWSVRGGNPTRYALAALAVSLELTGCAAGPAGYASPTPNFSRAVHLPLAGTLPRNASFAGVDFTVVMAEVTNVPPLSFSGEPTPGPDLIARLDLNAHNASAADADYQFTNDAFWLRTYSGQMIPAEDVTGIHVSLDLLAGASEEATLYFFVPEIDALDGAVLLIGRPPDAQAFLPLTGPVVPPDYPRDLQPIGGESTHAGPIEWTILASTLTWDRPPAVCCPETGVRANEDELFLTLSVRGTVDGSQYGQASITSDGVILLADGSPLGEGLSFEGRASVPEGESFEFQTAWVIPATATELVLQFGGSDVGTSTISLEAEE